MDYSISWAYIVSRMESLYGISPNNEDKVAFHEIEKHMNYIWEEYFEILYNKEKEQKNEDEISNIAKESADKISKALDKVRAKGMQKQNIKEDDEP